MNKKFLVFDLWSSYGHFKKPYTITSPLTYSIPTRTAVIGIIGAILGIEKGELYKTFKKDNTFISISIKSPIKKVRIAENLINTKTCKGKWFNRIVDRTQIKIEFLKDPCYRLYISLDNVELYNSLKKNLIEHTTMYTLSMGLSENLANFNFVGEYEAVEIVKNEEFKEIATVVPIEALKKGEVAFEDGEYFSETIPIEMNDDGVVQEYREVLYERNSKKVIAKLGEYLSLKDIEENICII